MAILEKLDKMKMELHTAKQALHEADNWTLLANDMEDVRYLFFFFVVISSLNIEMKRTKLFLQKNIFSGF